MGRSLGCGRTPMMLRRVALSLWGFVALLAVVWANGGQVSASPYDQVFTTLSQEMTFNATANRLVFATPSDLNLQAHSATLDALNTSGLLCAALSDAGPFCSGTDAANLTGTISAARLPTPTATTLGGVKSLIRPPNDYITGLDTTGAFTYQQIPCSDLSGAAASCGKNASELSSGTVPNARLPIGTGVEAWDASLDALAGTYSTGTCTISIGGATTNPTVTYSTQICDYTKVGNLVTVTFRDDISAISGGSGNIHLSGLPYTVAGQATEVFVGNLVASNVTWGSGISNLNITGVNGNSYLLLVGTGTGIAITNLQVSAITSTASLRGTITYQK